MAVTSLESVKAHLNIVDNTDDDNLLAQYRNAAEGWVEIFTGVSFADYFDDATQAYTVPAPLLQAVLIMVATWYEHRESVAIASNLEILPHGVHELVTPYRAWAF